VQRSWAGAILFTSYLPYFHVLPRSFATSTVYILSIACLLPKLHYPIDMDTNRTPCVICGKLLKPGGTRSHSVAWCKKQQDKMVKNDDYLASMRDAGESRSSSSFPVY